MKESIIDYKSITQVSLNGHDIVLCAKGQELLISIEECLQGWQKYARHEMEKEIPLSESRCIAVTFSSGHNYRVKFLNSPATEIIFYHRLFMLVPPEVLFTRFIRQINGFGYTMFNVD
jgi:hypothetical protein